MSDPVPTPKLKLRLATDVELPLIHILTTSEPYFYHVDPSLISYQDFLEMDIRWYVVVSDSGDYYGVVSFGHLDLVNRSASCGIVILPEKRQQGVATQVHSLVEKQTFNVMNLHRIWASVIEDNKVVWEALKKLGWSVCGHFKECQYMNGKWHNRIILEKGRSI